MRLKGRNIVVTGGSVGIGLAVSKKIASEGGTVIMMARDKDNLLKATNLLNTTYGKIHKTKHHHFVGDVSSIPDVEVFAIWAEQFGPIHGIVNCAGVYGPIGKTTEINTNDFLDTIKINLMGTIYMCSAFHDSFSNDYKKKIINFAGGGAANTFPNYSAYATSKVALVRFTENLAIELENENYEVNCIAPGFVATRIHQKTLKIGASAAGETFYENTKKQLESGATPPEKAADLTAFLLSDDSNGITGKFISAPWDNWEDKEFQELLKTDKDFATIRRIDNKTYFKK